MDVRTPEPGEPYPVVADLTVTIDGHGGGVVTVTITQDDVPPEHRSRMATNLAHAAAAGVDGALGSLNPVWPA